MRAKIHDMNIKELLDSHVVINKYKKDTKGEVFTPFKFALKVVNEFPSSVWSDPDFKWLEPSAGIGNIAIVVYFKLMEGLKKWEKNESKRSEHIIKNMLYMVELDKENCDKILDIFGNNVNLICGDFLADHKNSFCDHLSFDCIVGNPPFQDDYGVNKNGKRILGGRSKLYERIFIKSFSMLKNNGYLAFIVPDNMFAGNGSKSYQILIQNNVPFVSFNPHNQTFFPTIQQYICYFLLHKTQQKIPTSKTTIESNNHTFITELQNRPVNPVRNWNKHTENLIQTFVSNDKNETKYNRGKPISFYNGSKYPIIYTPSKLLHTNNIELAVGKGIKKAVIFAISTQLEFKMDYTGKYGVGPNTFYIPFVSTTQGKHLEKFLNSKQYKTLALATKTTRQYLKNAFIQHLKLTKIFNDNVKTKKKKNIANKTRKNKY